MTNVGTLIVGINGLDVQFRNFTNTDFPRVAAEQAAVEWSVAGASGLSGWQGPDKHLWQFSAIIDFPTQLLLKKVYAEFQARRKNRESSPEVTIYDWTDEFVERSRTRALCPGATATTDADGYVHYYAVFSAAITSMKFAKEGHFVSVQMVLTETGATTP